MGQFRAFDGGAQRELISERKKQRQINKESIARGMGVGAVIYENESILW